MALTGVNGVGVGVGVAAQALPVTAIVALRLMLCPPCVPVTVKVTGGHFGSVAPATGVPLMVPVAESPFSQLGKLLNCQVMGAAGFAVLAEKVYE